MLPNEWNAALFLHHDLIKFEKTWAHDPAVQWKHIYQNDYTVAEWQQAMYLRYEPMATYNVSLT